MTKTYSRKSGHVHGVNKASGIPRAFVGRPVHISNPQRCHLGWQRADKFSKFVPPDDTLKKHSLTLFLHFFVKHFPKLLNLTLRKTLFCG